MSHEDFTRGMDRLSKTYGERNYPGPRVEGIWRVVGQLPAWAWDNIVDTLICERNTPPMRNQIIEAARPYLDQVEAAEFGQMMNELRTYDACRWCKYTGLIRVRRFDPEVGTYEAVFRCSYCRAAELRKLSRRILLWNLQPGWEAMYAEGGCPDPWDVPSPHEAERPGPRDPHEHEPPAQPGRVQAIVAGALVGKQIEILPPADIDFEQIEIDL